MNLDGGIQAEMLFRSFKATSVVPEEVPAEPPPTPGDLVRNVASDINASRDEDVAASEERAQALWLLNNQPKEAPQ